MRNARVIVLLAALLALGAACAPAPPPQPPSSARSQAAQPASAAGSSAGAPPAQPSRAEGSQPAPASNAGESGAAPADAAPTAPAAPIPLRFAYSAISANTTPFWVALERGYFREAGFDVEAVFLGASAAMQALLAEDVQLAIVGPEGIDVNLEYGSPVTRYVAGVQTRLVFKLLATPTIQSVQELRGKTMSASRPGSMGFYGARKALELGGLNPDTDVSMLYAGNNDASFEAFMAGLADATMGAPPRDVQAIKQGRAVLMDLGQLDVPYFGAGMIVRDAYATANAGLLEQFLRPYLRGVATAHAELPAAIEVLAKYFRTDDQEALRASYDAYEPTWSRDQLVPEAAIVAQLQASDRPAAKTADPRDFYDNRYLERLKQSGYVDSLYAGR
ncbi:MAG TPA: ABC transporter substrate-binding protein [Chloroflexota bacterium]|nr:ABC transporter substrate-binding protein [Chloroflexota bacterium]